MAVAIGHFICLVGSFFMVVVIPLMAAHEKNGRFAIFDHMWWKRRSLRAISSRDFKNSARISEWMPMTLQRDTQNSEQTITTFQSDTENREQAITRFHTEAQKHEQAITALRSDAQKT
jgi:hypothetical protein